jgi:hypothetical protein
MILAGGVVSSTVVVVLIVSLFVGSPSEVAVTLTLYEPAMASVTDSRTIVLAPAARFVI